MSLSSSAEVCIQGGDGIQEPMHEKETIPALQSCSGEAEDLQLSLEKFLSAEECLLSESFSSLSNFSSNTLKKYRETYFRLLFVVLNHDLRKSNLQYGPSYEHILEEITAYTCEANKTLDFQIENNLIQASVSYIDHHCAFQQDIHDVDLVSSDQRRAQLLSNIRNALLRIMTTCCRQSRAVNLKVPFISSQALLELQVEAIDSAQAKTSEKASHLNLVRSCKAFKNLLIDTRRSFECTLLEKLLHIGRINGYLYIVAVKLLYETIGMISAIYKETKPQLHSCDSSGDNDILRFNEALFNFKEAKCTLLSVIGGNFSLVEFEETFQQTFYLFLRALFRLMNKLSRRRIEMVAFNSLEANFVNALKGDVPKVERSAFMKLIAQFHSYIAEKMESVHQGSVTESVTVVDNLMTALTAPDINQENVTAEDILSFVSEIKRRLVNDDNPREEEEEKRTLNTGGVLERLNEAVGKFVSALYSGEKPQISDVSDAQDSCLASLWASKMFPEQSCDHLPPQKLVSEDTTAPPGVTLGFESLFKEDGDITSDVALYATNGQLTNLTSGVGDTEKDEEATTAGCKSFDLTLVSVETEDVQPSMESSNDGRVVVKEEKAESCPTVEKEQEEEMEVRNVCSATYSMDRQKKKKKKKRKKLLSKPKLEILAEAADIIRHLEKARHLYSKARQIFPSIFSADGRQEENVTLKEEEEEKLEEQKNDKIEEKEAESLEKRTKTTKIKVEKRKVIKAKEEDRLGFISQDRISKTVQLRACDVSETLFTTSELVRPSLQPIFRHQEPQASRTAPCEAYEPTCVRLDREFGRNRPQGDRSSSRRSSCHESLQARDTAFSQLAETVLRGQLLPLETGPEAKRRSAAFTAEVVGSLHNFTAAHERAAASAVWDRDAPAPEPPAQPPSRKKFEDEIEIEPRGDGSFVARKRKFQAPATAPRGAMPLYGRCRI